eukprot:6923637-Prymnesium_polylepis.1
MRAGPTRARRSPPFWPTARQRAACCSSSAGPRRWSPTAPRPHSRWARRSTRRPSSCEAIIREAAGRRAALCHMWRRRPALRNGGCILGDLRAEEPAVMRDMRTIQNADRAKTGQMLAAMQCGA